MNRRKVTVLFVAIVLLVLIPLLSGCGLLNRGATNVYDFAGNKIDELTKYDIIKEVEDSARTMIASYESDKLVYDQYKNSDNAEKQSWGEQAKMRANKTASTYNNYILKNSFVWKNNIPSDIYKKLEIIY